MKAVFIMAVCIALTACDRTPSDHEAKARRAAQQAKAEAAASKLLVPRMLRAGEHQLVVLEILSVGDFGVDKQRCYVWRDTEFKTATMSCPGGEPTLDVPPP